MENSLSQRLVLISVRHIPAAGLPSTFTNIFSERFVVFWTDISPNLTVSSCCMFPKVAKNKAYRSHAYIMDLYWEKIQAHQCRNPRDKKNYFSPVSSDANENVIFEFSTVFYAHSPSSTILRQIGFLLIFLYN